MWGICLKMSTSTYVPCHCSTHVACSRNIFTLVIGNYSHSLLDWPKPPSSSLARLLMNWYSTQAHLSLKRQMDMVPWIDIIDVLSWIRFQYLVVWTDQMTKESRWFSKKKLSSNKKLFKETNWCEFMQTQMLLYPQKCIAHVNSHWLQTAKKMSTLFFKWWVEGRGAFCTLFQVHKKGVKIVFAQYKIN